MTYIQISFPEKKYEDNLYINSIISEKDGIKLCTAFMKEILDTQLENNSDPNIVIMSQVYIPNYLQNSGYNPTEAHE